MIIRPLDGVAGYVVADGQPAEALGGLLSANGPAFPGRDNQIWVAAHDVARRMLLVGDDGRPTGPSVDSTDTFPVAGDETGLLVMNDTSGRYLAGAGRPQLITAGNPVAIGPTKWLTAERTPSGCALVVTDRASRAMHVLGAAGCKDNVPFPGIISPDGRTAAIVVGTAPALTRSTSSISGQAQTVSLLPGRSSVTVPTVISCGHRTAGSCSSSPWRARATSPTLTGRASKPSRST